MVTYVASKVWYELCNTFPQVYLNLKSHLIITYYSVVKLFWDFVQSATVSLPYFAQFVCQNDLTTELDILDEWDFVIWV